jgi:catechol-2,3-dioxygenase
MKPTREREREREEEIGDAIIQIRRIACASFETPDIERLTDYYVNVIGLSLAAREKDAVYLASVLDHSVVLHTGPCRVALAFCSRLLPIATSARSRNSSPATA